MTNEFLMQLNAQGTHAQRVSKKTITIEPHRVVDKFGEVKDRASDNLHIIRKQMNAVRSKLLRFRPTRWLVCIDIFMASSA